MLLSSPPLGQDVVAILVWHAAGVQVGDLQNSDMFASAVPCIAVTRISISVFVPAGALFA